MTDSGIAVVVTGRDLSDLVVEAVGSVLAQQAQPREIVIVDDGSQGGRTAETLAALSSSTTECGAVRVRVVSADGGGAGHARNVGIAATDSPLVALLDGDDLFEPNYLAVARELLDERPGLSFVCCSLQSFGADDGRFKPPPYSAAEALGRGVCGHAATVFRREVWMRTGGFDEQLPAFEIADFWLRAHELGFRGVVLDEALVRNRVHSEVPLAGLLADDNYLDAKRSLLAKHRGSALRSGADVFVTMLDEHVRQRRRGHELQVQRTQLQHELASVDAELDQVSASLSERGISCLQPPDLSAEPTDGANGIERYLLERALREVAPEPWPRRAAMLGGDDDLLPDVSRKLDLLVVDRTLELHPDPRMALESCRDALRPGGQLVACVATAALGPARHRAFTETALRELLLEQFPRDGVAVQPYGNLATSVAAALGLPPAALSDAERDATDDLRPTLLVGTARAPVDREPRRASLRRRAPPRPVWQRRSSRPTRGAILAYRRVADLHPDIYRCCTPPDVFASHMRLLAERYRPISLSQLVAEARSRELSPGSVAVTFDHGYLDTLEAASPIAVELGIPISVFADGVPSDRPTEPWPDAIERVLFSDHALPPELSVELEDSTLELRAGSAAERRDTVLRLTDVLARSSRETIDAVVGQLCRWSGIEPDVRRSHRLLTAAELIELSQREEHEIGVLAPDHWCLSSPDPSEQADDLKACKRGLERLLESSVSAIAYPSGRADLNAAEIAARAGFQIGCTSEREAVTCDCDPLRVPRLEISGHDVQRLGSVLAGALRTQGVAVTRANGAPA